MGQRLMVYNERGVLVQVMNRKLLERAEIAYMEEKNGIHIKYIVSVEKGLYARIKNKEHPFFGRAVEILGVFEGTSQLFLRVVGLINKPIIFKDGVKKITQDSKRKNFDPVPLYGQLPIRDCHIPGHMLSPCLHHL